MNPQEAPPPSPSPLLELLAWVEVNKLRLAQALGALLVLGLAVYTLQHFRDQAEQRAGESLLALQRTADAAGTTKPDSGKFLALAAAHSGTEAGRRALLLGAGALFSEKKFDLARARFEEVLTGSPAGSGAPTAMLGVAASIEAAGKLDDALKAYERVVATFATEPEAVQAQLAIALLHEAKQQDDQALKIYDEVLRAQRQTVWRMEANMRRDMLVARNPQLSPTNLVVPILAPPRALPLPVFTNVAGSSTNAARSGATTNPPAKK